MPDHLLPPGETGFLLRVRGDSMSGGGIYDGDPAVVRPATPAEHRQIVVAIVGDPDTAATRWRRDEGEGRPEQGGPCFRVSVRGSTC